MVNIPGITSRAMFGGHGLYLDGVIFGMIVNDELFFKVDDSNKLDYEKLASQPFTYQGKSGKPYAMSYWQVPVEYLDNPKRLDAAVKQSTEISRRLKKK